ncbi:hypothetical protein BDR26DRAFT_381231 [Obelidium mucronatum]|nr:hypothetical protein BDR26DRAFT_381231 [Obelidium mucronatum]
MMPELIGNGLADRLAGLRYLNLKANALTEFPRVLCDMQRLEILDLSRNKITHFPDSLGALASTLKVFSIAKNRITLIPEYFGDMNQLEVFKLDGNPIQWPPAEVIASVSDGVPTHLKEFLKLNVTPIHLQSPSVSLTIVEQSPPHPQLLPAPSFSLSQIIETHLQTPSFTKNTSISIK